MINGLNSELKDIEHVLSTLFDKITHLESKVGVLERENAHFRFKCHQLELDNRRLQERLSAYESPKKDSHNSHIAPSQEDLSSRAIRRTRSLQQKSGKPSGGQTGHKGHTLEFRKVADTIQTHQMNYCPRCGQDLDSKEVSGIETRWSIDLPVVAPQITRHQIVSKQCSCGWGG